MRRIFQNCRSLLADSCPSQLRGLSRSAHVDSAASRRPQMPQRHPRAAAVPAAGPAAAAAAPETGEATAAVTPGISTAAAPAADAAADAELAKQRRMANAMASSLMFPWEKRQFDSSGGGLRTWEKLYWGVFVSSISVFLFSRVLKPAPPEPVVDEEREARKAEMARALLAGRQSLLGAGADVFDGLSPAEIQEYVAKATEGATSADPFDGMSPEEINEYVARHGATAAAS